MQRAHVVRIGGNALRIQLANAIVIGMIGHFTTCIVQ